MRKITGKLYQVNSGYNPQTTYTLLNLKESSKELQALLLDASIKLSIKDCSRLVDFCGTQTINIFNRGRVQQRNPQLAFDDIMANIVGDAENAVDAIKDWLATY